MTVIRPNSVSGITSITAQANEINFFRSNGALAGLQLNGVNFNTTTGVSTFNNLDVGGVLTYQDVTNVDSVGIITARSNIDCNGDLDVDGHTNLDNVSVAGVTTFTGNANFGSNGYISGSANFSLTSNKLRVTGSDTVGLEVQRSSNATIQCTETTNNTDLQLRANSDGGLVRTATNKPLILGTYQQERLRISSNGLVNIGAGSSASGLSPLLHLHKNASNSSAYFHITNNDTGITNNDGFLLGVNPSGDCLVFNKDSTPMRFATAGIERLRIDAGGGLQLGTSTATASKFTVYGANDAAAIFQGSGTGTGAGNGLLVGNNGGTTGLLWNYENGNTLFATNNIERLRINSSGAVMINTTNSSSRTLNLKGTFGILSASQTGVIDMSVTDAGEASIGPYVAGGSSLVFKTNSSGAGVAERLRIDASGLTTLQQASSGNLVEPLRLRNAAAGANTDVGMIFYNNGAGAMARIKAYDAGTYNGGLIFETAPTAGSLNNNTSEALRITNTGAFYIKSPNGSTGDQPGEIQWWNENGAGVMAKIVAYREGTNYAPSGLKFYTTQNVDTSANNSQGDITERLFINSEGKFYKGGHQFYPLVQIYEARVSGSVSNSTVGSYQDIKTVATYTPKKVGNRVHVQVICQSWNGSQTDGQSDAYARLQHNNGGSYSTFTECDRVQGNFQFDERYHHAPFIMDGWFTTTTTNSTTIKFQGMQYGTLPVAFNWFHSYGGRVTIMEYDIT